MRKFRKHLIGGTAKFVEAEQLIARRAAADKDRSIRRFGQTHWSDFRMTFNKSRGKRTCLERLQDCLVFGQVTGGCRCGNSFFRLQEEWIGGRLRSGRWNLTKVWRSRIANRRQTAEIWSR